MAGFGGPMAGQSPERLTAANYRHGEPQAPGTPRTTRSSEAIDRIALHLRDDLNVHILLRDGTFSPARNGNHPASKLYNLIQHLYWKSPKLLDQLVDEFEEDCMGHLKNKSSEARSKALYDVLADHSRMVRDSFQQSPLTFSPGKPPKTTSPNRVSGVSDVTPIKFKLAKSAGTTSASLRSKASNSSLKASMSSTSTESFSRATRSSASSRASAVTAMTSFDSATTNEPGRGKAQEHVPSSYACSEGYMSVLDSFGHENIDRLDVGGDTEPDSAPENDRPAKRRRSNDNEVLPEYKVNQERTPPETPPLTEKGRAQQYQIRLLPSSGFGPDPYPSPYDLGEVGRAIERARVVHHLGLNTSKVEHVQSQDDVKLLLAKKPGRPFAHSAPAVWAQPTPGDPRLMFCGAIQLNPKRDGGHLFQLVIHPVKVTKSCRMQRHFRWDRFFYVTVPSLRNEDLPQHLNKQEKEMDEKFKEWLKTPHRLLGRTWRAVHLEQLKQKKQPGGKRFDRSKVLRVIFFATDGQGLEDVPLEKCMDWMVPFEQNSEQRLCKAVARFDLMFSATTPTVQFRPDQVRLGKHGTGIPDVPADGMHEDNSFKDESKYFADMPQKEFDRNEPMTDGCSRMSPGAALLVCRHLGITSRPSAFQGRINGAKGMWCISGPYETADLNDFWIEIRQSQLKVHIRPEDLDPELCEPDRWSFDVVSYSHAAKPSEVHRDFMRILEDRGVERQILKQIVQDGLKIRTQELIEAVDDAAALTLWRSRNFGWYEDAKFDESRGIPRDAALRTKIFVEKAGYMPAECPILADAVERLAEMHLQEIRSQIRVPCIKSTILVGIADPSGKLNPGEVYISLSQALESEMIEGDFNDFTGQELLIARHPTLRGSDMQKVRAVYCPELAHLKDVIVMPVHGKIPLAAKLQGGDYDGDKFWICADERLTRDFRNVPVFAQPDIDHFGIRQDTTTLGGVASHQQMGSPSHAAAVLSRAFAFSLEPDILGRITNHYYKLSGRHNSLWTPGVLAMAGLHDLIIDAPKNGYSYTENDLNAYLKRNGYPALDAVDKMAFQKNIESMNLSFKSEDRKKLVDIATETCRKKTQGMHILDDLLFNTINPEIALSLRQLERALRPTRQQWHDADLAFNLHELEKVSSTHSGIDVKQEQKRLRDMVRPVLEAYHLAWTAKNDEERSIAMNQCYEKYDALGPQDQSNPWWLFRPAEMAPTNWECFKVAAISMQNDYSPHKSLHKFLFHMAKTVVCYLKSHSKSGQDNINKVLAIKKPKKPPGGLHLLREVAEADELVSDENETDEFASSLDEVSFEELM